MSSNNPQIIEGECIVVCRSCGSIWSPAFESPLWWAAKQRADKGFLDAYNCSGEQCGCIEKPAKSDAPYRVFGYTGLCEDFDIPCKTFADAVRTYRKFETDMVSITGVSVAVKNKLQWGF